VKVVVGEMAVLFVGLGGRRSSLLFLFGEAPECGVGGFVEGSPSKTAGGLEEG
jgi:hypothetical protein